MAWDDDDQDKALAFVRVENDTCPGCRNALSDTTEFEKRASWQVETVTCHACRTRDSQDQHAGPGEFRVVTPRSDRV